jgi:hypothetical protein
MPQIEEFIEYAQWEKRCLEKGLEGPYKISGQDRWQFVRSDGSTGALWNVPHQKGVIL